MGLYKLNWPLNHSRGYIWLGGNGFCTLIYLYLIVTPKYLCFILLTPHPSSDCKPCHCCLAVIFDWQLWRPITAKPPTLCGAFYPLIGQLFRRAVPQKRHCLLTNHSSLPSRLFPALFAVSVTFFRSLYQRYFQLRFIPVSPQHLYRGYYELISNFFLCLCSSKAEGSRGARHFVPVISNISKQQVGMMLTDTLIMLIWGVMICGVLETMDDGDVWGVGCFIPITFYTADVVKHHPLLALTILKLRFQLYF